jgi:replicative DNA helicase
MSQDIKIPPHSIEAEESVLGALLIDQDTIFNIAPILEPSHFYQPDHQKIYEAILSLYEEREPIDLVTVAEALKKTKSLKKIGGQTYLTSLIEKVPTSAHAEHYAKIIRDMAVRRELITSASGLVEMAFDESLETGKLLDKGEQFIFSLSQRHIARNFIHIKDALAESFDRLDSLQKSTSGLRGVPTGFSDLDNSLAGMQASNLLILAGRPGLGKTALALNMAQYAAVREKIPVGFFSLEMSKEELVDRLLVSGAEIDAWRLKTGKLDDEDFSRLSDAMGVLAEAPLFIDDSPGISVQEMRTKARRLQVEKGLKLLIVDYLQLATPGRRWDSRVQEVSEISQGLKNLARELKIPVLALSQLSRAVEARGTRIPQLADLRESGAIEQDADVVMFLYRENEEDFENIILSIAKHRNGPLRTIPLRFRGDRIKFYPAEMKRKG